MATVKRIYAYEIIDSRGYPTIEGRLWLDNGVSVVTSVPSGASVGKYEAIEIRDNDPARFDSMGVSKGVYYINNLLGPKLVGVDPQKQQEVDMWLIKADGTKNKGKLGANTILTISELFVKAGALVQGQSLFRYINSLHKTIFKGDIKIERVPTPIFNIINGGKHANNNLEFQEFQIIPSSSLNFTQAYQMGVEVFHELRRVLKYRNTNISVGDEGGFAPNFPTNLDAIEVINETILKKNLKLGLDIFLGLDVAATEFFKDDHYHLKDKPHPLKKEEYYQLIEGLLEQYSLLSIEDPFAEDDVEDWAKLTSKVSKEVYIIGDDNIATNKERLLQAIKRKACTSVLVKPNQIGTITETLEVVDVAIKNNFSYVVSHRSGETNDTFIADFAVGVQADFCKLGAPSRGERVAKYNRLWQIERDELKG